MAPQPVEFDSREVEVGWHGRSIQCIKHQERSGRVAAAPRLGRDAVVGEGRSRSNHRPVGASRSSSSNQLRITLISVAFPHASSGLIITKLFPSGAMSKFGTNM